MLKWIGSDKNYYDYIKDTWTVNVLGSSDWNQALHDGFYAVNTSITVEEVAAVAAPVVAVEEVVANAEIPLASALRSLVSADTSGMELVLYSKIGMGDGQMANNPWLQEFPDPITRVSWDNYVTVSKVDAEKLGFVNENVANGGLDGSYAKVTVNGVSVTNVPVIIQPGQAVGSIGLSFGYGKKEGVKTEMQTGVNAYPLYQDFSSSQNVSIEKVAGNHEFACVQLHKTLMGRGDIIKETTLEIFNTKDAAEWNIQPMVSLDMHWLRIDRYYSSEDTFEGDNKKKENADGLGLGNYVFGDREGDGSLSTFDKLEDPSANPQVAFQPVMCQHCNHAPCETVCPVAATSHGRQGQNHMAYNRCVGTRYCANNCPYKVRRFNWFLYNDNDEFDYHMNNDLGKMVINPDVTVRSRGVMEKCSMCIQKTQKTILDAKRDGRVVKDGEFQTACSSACSNGAMAFGDVNDEESKIAELKESNRMYHLLEHVGTKPNVFYHVKVRNTEEV